MIAIEKRDSFAILTINMPDRSMNVLNDASMAALDKAFAQVIHASDITGIVLTSGKPAFVAGADLAVMEGFAAKRAKPADVMAWVSGLNRVFRRIETCGKPVVGAATGTALGGGLELLLACHYRIAANEPGAQFGLPEVGLGLLPGLGGTQRLPRLIGIEAALPLILDGRPIDVQRAMALGIFNDVVARDQLIEAALDALRAGKVEASQPWDRKGFKLPGGVPMAPRNAQMFVATNGLMNAQRRDGQEAPLAILRTVFEGTPLPIEKGLTVEQRYFVKLVQGNSAQNMIRSLFFAKQNADKLTRRPKAIGPTRMTKIGLLGAGLMGSGIAQVSALAGYHVVLVDRDEAIARTACERIYTGLAAEVLKGRLKDEDMASIVKRLTPGKDYSAFADCDMVIEAILEDEGVKAEAIRAVEAVLPAHAIFASNTSALPINGLARASQRPQNLIGLHFFSPVPKMALVEVIRGDATSDETLARALDYVKATRKTPIIVNDGYGFYTTRCVDAYVREGLQLIADGADPVMIEHAGEDMGMPVGPLALADEVGIDVMDHIARFFRTQESGSWADDRHRVNPLISTIVSQGRLGRKAGKGFYLYPESGKRLDRPFIASLVISPALQGVSFETMKERLLYAQLVEAQRCQADGVVEDTVEADLGALLGWAFPSQLGGPYQAIEDIGVQAFAARCAVLVQSEGERFALAATRAPHHCEAVA